MKLALTKFTCGLMLLGFLISVPSSAKSDSPRISPQEAQRRSEKAARKQNKQRKKLNQRALRQQRKQLKKAQKQDRKANRELQKHRTF